MSYQFIPWVKTGTGAAVTAADPLTDAPASRVVLPAALKVNKKYDAAINLRLFGPGDVVGLDQQQIIRVEPRPLTPDFEPNYFPTVEFLRPDLPWIFTPATGDAKGRLRPWLCLVVVRQQEGVRLGNVPNRPLPVLSIAAPARPSAELPDLADSWAWAHTHVVGQEQGAALIDLLKGDTPRTISRIVAPARLRPSTRYYACLVPAFEAGRKAGLGLDAGPEDDKLTPAWKSGTGAPVAIDLPVYFHWEFGTGVGGDFEALVRRLQGRPVPDGVGVKNMQVSGLGFGLPDLGVMPFEGALRSPKGPGKPPDPAKLAQFGEALRSVLSTTIPRSGTADPIVGPPVYGHFHAVVKDVPAAKAAPVWLGDLNLDPRFRGVAGFGTFVVQDQQEQLMASAWDQLAGVQRAMQIVRQADLAMRIGEKVVGRHLAGLNEPQLLQLTAPVHTRLRFQPQTQALAAASSAPGSPSAPAMSTVPSPTVQEALSDSYIASGMTTGAFRRTFRSGGPIARRAAATAPTPVTAPVTTRLVQLMMSTPTSIIQMHIVRGFVTTGQVKSQIDNLRDKVVSGAAPTQEALRFLAAGDQVRAYLASLPVQTLPNKPSPPSLTAVKQSVLAGLDPKTNITLRLRATLNLPQPVAGAAALAAPVPSSSPLDGIVMPHPEFLQPMYEALRDISSDYLLPGAANIPPETVTIVKTNPQFVESFMIGLNHEMSRELLWREYPTDQRGTYFNRFWDVGGQAGAGQQPQIPDINTWGPSTALGSHFMSDGFEGRLVLLIRGDVLRRYPGTVIYAVKADTFGTPQAQELYPIFRGALDPDMVFLGFDLTEDAARGGAGQPGYFFVLQEQPAEPRFGLDGATQFGMNPATLTTWDDLSWGHIAADAAAFENLSYLPLSGALTGRRMENAEWAFNSAHMARIMLQKRVRVAIHGSELLPPKA